MVFRFTALLVEDADEPWSWDENLDYVADIVKLFLIQFTAAEEKNGGADGLHRGVAGGEHEVYRCRTAYISCRRSCFRFNGVGYAIGSTRYTADDIPSRWSPLVHDGENRSYIKLELFPVRRFMSREVEN